MDIKQLPMLIRTRNYKGPIVDYELCNVQALKSNTYTTHQITKVSCLVYCIQGSQTFIISFELNSFIVKLKLLALPFKTKYNFETQKFSDLPYR